MSAETKKMAFFDFDYTLAKTTECVRVWSPRGTREYFGKPYKLLTPSEFNALNLAEDESINEDSFIEFQKVNYKRATQIKSVFMFLNFFLKEEETIIKVLSARPQVAEATVFKFLQKNLDYKKKIDSIEFKGCKSSDHRIKYDYIVSNTDCSNIGEVYVFDDNKKLIDHIAVNYLANFQNRKIITCFVEHNNNLESLHFKFLQC